jgi:AcrR family transcriptional regulator
MRPPLPKTRPSGSADENRPTKRDAVIGAALSLFLKRGYRKTSIDDIAEVAQVAKRTVYLHFQDKEAVFLAVVDYLGELVRARCDAALRKNSDAATRLGALLNAYYGLGAEMFGESEHLAELAEAVSKLAARRVADTAATYEQCLKVFLGTLIEAGEIDGPPAGLTTPQIVKLLMRSADAAKRAPDVSGNQARLRSELAALSVLTVAAMRRVA